MNSIKDRAPEPLPNTVSLFIKVLIGSLLDKNPEKRPTACSILKLDQIKEHVVKIID